MPTIFVYPSGWPGSCSVTIMFTSMVFPGATGPAVTVMGFVAGMLPAEPGSKRASSGENVPPSESCVVVSHMFARVKVMGALDVFVSCVVTSPVTDVGIPYHPPVTRMIEGAERTTFEFPGRPTIASTIMTVARRISKIDIAHVAEEPLSLFIVAVCDLIALTYHIFAFNNGFLL